MKNLNLLLFSLFVATFTFGQNVLIPHSNSLYIGAADDSGKRLRLTNDSIHSYIDYNENLYFRSEWYTEATMVMQRNGSVGIGMGTSLGWPAAVEGQTHVPFGYKLGVNGGIICERVTVISDVPSSDYVFEPNYYLRPLSELELFIQTNKHLPEVKSADEFAEEGYDIGAMDDVLLRKVEELTLYIIQMQKEIDSLKAELVSDETEEETAEEVKTEEVTVEEVKAEEVEAEKVKTEKVETEEEND